MRTQPLPRIGASIAASALLLTGCAGTTGGGTDSLTIGSRTAPQGFDPVNAIGSALPYYQAVYDTLIKREPDGSYSPMLATAWDLDPTRTKLSLTLRQGVAFGDGTPFNAEAVKANLERFKNTPGSNTRWLTDLEAVDVVDPAHVDLKLKQPNPAMLYYLSDSAGLMANPAKFAQPESLKATPDGTGPYKLNTAKTVTGTKWVYERNDQYWGTKLPYKTVTYNYFDNETAIVNGLKSGQLDAAVLLDADQQLAVESGFTTKSTPQNFDFSCLMLLDRDGVLTPALKDVRVRQALNYAVDRQTMLRSLQRSKGEVTSQVFGTQAPGYKKELDAYYTYDPAKAKALLDQAGFGKGFTLKLPRPVGMVNDALAASLQTDFKAIGVTLVWDQFDPTQFAQKVFTGRQYSGLVMNLGQYSNDWAVANDWVAPGPFNMFGNTDPTIQDLMAKMKTDTGDQEKAEAQALNQHLVEQAWFLPFYRVTYLHVTDGTVNVVPQDGMAVPSIYNYTPAK
ncbi:ABC transporter substrate-binding protein [Yinghuangia aomiensis]|uniref:ABC transporter substrate-binding protein n=1 Tax=Yinghuangia aomiensis TaxID=676205 RepID=A0ABP9GYM2_9ACTN